LRPPAIVRGESLWLFLLVFAVLGCFVNTRNQLSWNVQHAWVESLAERGVMHPEGSPTSQFALSRLGDVWVGPDGHSYARKPPAPTSPPLWPTLCCGGLSGCPTRAIST
jgi:hypothetical protein